MKKEAMGDLSASVKARLLNIARERQEEFQSLLTRYAAERFLYRLSQSDYQQNFVLKGATLFALWTGDIHRPTRDLDLLGHGDPQIPYIVAIFTAICEQVTADDGLQFLPDTIRGAKIKEEDDYEGVRITLEAMLGKAKIPLQIDIGFGDVITPLAQEAEMPALLKMPAARLRIYPRETVIAEKLEAIVHLGLSNSRMKDFYDLWYLACRFDFDGELLGRAIAATFHNRGTAIPSQVPPGLTEQYYNDADRQRQWQAFVRKSNLPSEQIKSFENIVVCLRGFLMPLVQAVSNQTVWNQKWNSDSASWEALTE